MGVVSSTTMLMLPLLHTIISILQLLLVLHRGVVSYIPNIMGYWMGMTLMTRRRRIRRRRRRILWLLRLLVPNLKSSKPNPPDTSQMSPTEAKAAMKQYRKDCKISLTRSVWKPSNWQQQVIIVHRLRSRRTILEIRPHQSGKSICYSYP